MLLAAQVLRDRTADIRVILVERSGALGRGLAYGTPSPRHILNVVAGRMSAYADDPTHFLRWLAATGAEASPDAFVPRQLFGAYLAHLLADGDPRLQVVRALCTDLVETSAGIEARLDTGASLMGHMAILALGHDPRPAHGATTRLGSPEDTPLAPDAPVMILGSGLSMVDTWLSLDEAGHSGPITVVSRHGRIPLPHRQVAALPLEAADIPFGTGLGYFTRWLREVIGDVEARGGDWRSVIDALRPFNQRIWQDWPAPARRRFIAHLRSLWNIHRHRLPADLHARLEQAIRAGRLSLLAGTVSAVTREGELVRAAIRHRGAANDESFAMARIYDCGGLVVDPADSANPLVQSLLAAGLARPDPLRLGLDVDRTCRLVAADGRPSSRLFAIGPLTRGAFYEIEAIPDIRLQCTGLAARIIAQPPGR